MLVSQRQVRASGRSRAKCQIPQEQEKVGSDLAAGKLHVGDRNRYRGAGVEGYHHWALAVQTCFLIA